MIVAVIRCFISFKNLFNKMVQSRILANLCDYATLAKSWRSNSPVVVIPLSSSPNPGFAPFQSISSALNDLAISFSLNVVSKWLVPSLCAPLLNFPSTIKMGSACTFTKLILFCVIVAIFICCIIFISLQRILIFSQLQYIYKFDMLRYQIPLLTLVQQKYQLLSYQKQQVSKLLERL